MCLIYIPGVEHKNDIVEQLEYRKVDNVVFNSTSPLEVDQPKIESKWTIRFGVCKLVLELAQSPNTVEMVVTQKQLSYGGGHYKKVE